MIPQKRLCTGNIRPPTLQKQCITLEEAINTIGDFNNFSIQMVYDMCSISDLKKMPVEDYQPVYNKLLKMIEMKKRGCDA